MKYLLQNRFRFLMLVIAPLFLSACNPGGCRAFVNLPVKISVKGIEGKWIEGYTVSYKLDNGPTTEKVCEAAFECVLDGLYGDSSSVTVSKNGFESVTVNPREFIDTYSNNDCTLQSTVAITLKTLS